MMAREKFQKGARFSAHLDFRSCGRSQGYLRCAAQPIESTDAVSPWVYPTVDRIGEPMPSQNRRLCRQCGRTARARQREWTALSS